MSSIDRDGSIRPWSFARHLTSVLALSASLVAAPVGATVTTLPSQAVVVNENNYYYGGTYYEKTGGSYKVVAPVAGTVVEHLPEGGEEVTIGEQKYVKFGETYYQPIQKHGKNMYEVVEVK